MSPSVEGSLVKCWALWRFMWGSYGFLHETHERTLMVSHKYSIKDIAEVRLCSVTVSTQIISPSVRLLNGFNFRLSCDSTH